MFELTYPYQPVHRIDMVYFVVHCYLNGKLDKRSTHPHNIEYIIQRFVHLLVGCSRKIEMAEEPPTDAPIESAELTPDNAANNKAEVNVAKD